MQITTHTSTRMRVIRRVLIGMGLLPSLFTWAGCTGQLMLERQDLLWEHKDSCTYALETWVQDGVINIGSMCQDNRDTVSLPISDCIGNDYVRIGMNKIPIPKFPSIGCKSSTGSTIHLDSSDNPLDDVYAYPIEITECFRYQNVVLIEQTPILRGSRYQYWLQFQDSAEHRYSIELDEYFNAAPECTKSYGDRFLILSFVVHEEGGRGHVGIIDLDHVVQLCKDRGKLDTEYWEINFDRRKM